MLFCYKKISHKINDFNNHVNYFFEKLFTNTFFVFDETLMLEEKFYKTIKSSNKFLNFFKDITYLYNSIDINKKNKIEDAFKNNTNTDIFSDTSIEPIKYSELDEKITHKLREFYDYLWDKYPQVDDVEENYNTVKSHYDLIAKDVNICPFCGIEVFKPTGGIGRENYDHILAKADYPFISLNLNFVVPTCRVCNIDEKKKKDTLFSKGGERRKFYNPYNEDVKFENLDVGIILNEDYNKEDVKTLLKSVDWKYEFKRNNSLKDELSTWDDIYRIGGRYKEHVSTAETEWFEEVLRKYRREINKGHTFVYFKKEFIEDAKYAINSPLGIIRYSYFRFIFSLDNIKERLKEFY